MLSVASTATVFIRMMTTLLFLTPSSALASRVFGCSFCFPKYANIIQRQVRQRRVTASSRFPYYPSESRLFATNNDVSNNFDELMDALLKNDTGNDKSIRTKQDATKTATTAMSNNDYANDDDDERHKTAKRSSLTTRSDDDNMSEATTTAGGWRKIDWESIGPDIIQKYIDLMNNNNSNNNSNDKQQQSLSSSSYVDVKIIRDRVVYVKRDDELRLQGSQISGNKARKMLALHELPADDFPECIVSYGGPQSNAMLALAAIVQYQNHRQGIPETTSSNNDASNNVNSLDNHINDSNNVNSNLNTGDDNNLESDIRQQPQQQRRKRFVYYTKKLPKFLKNHPSGNLFRAMSLGMELIELSVPEYNDLFGSLWGGNEIPPPAIVAPVPQDSVWIPQGGAIRDMAYIGTKLLAYEIYTYWYQYGNDRPLSICIPGGTCTTAVLVHRALQEIQQYSKKQLDLSVVVIPCVGNDAYARRQMIHLNTKLIKNKRICNLDNNEDDNNNNNDNAGEMSSSQESHEQNPFDVPYILRSSPPENTLVSSASYFGQKSSKKSNQGYYTFGEPDISVLNTFRELRDEYNFVLDLLYGAPAFTILLRYWRSLSEYDKQITTSPLIDRSSVRAPRRIRMKFSYDDDMNKIDPYNNNTDIRSDNGNISSDGVIESTDDEDHGNHSLKDPISSTPTAPSPLHGRQIMYVHSGGLEGISTQLLRYKYKGLVDKYEVQVP